MSRVASPAIVPLEKGEGDRRSNDDGGSSRPSPQLHSPLGASVHGAETGARVETENEIPEGNRLSVGGIGCGP